ncbi:hypothetical protein PR048_023255 [Dryococelus australis]|uniref:Uncharacterized protein n=1 Tax=Dryococelus australis TaxID=614101 RepID=A0ABQ9GTK3_9NEOP|nr:hypothetical protein PR048_023255 [Dryococelus australis]
MRWRGNRVISEKIRLPAASSGTIPTCKNLGATPLVIENSSSWWKGHLCGYSTFLVGLSTLQAVFHQEVTVFSMVTWWSTDLLGKAVVAWEELATSYHNAFLQQNMHFAHYLECGFGTERGHRPAYARLVSDQISSETQIMVLQQSRYYLDVLMSPLRFRAVISVHFVVSGKECKFDSGAPDMELEQTIQRPRKGHYLQYKEEGKGVIDGGIVTAYSHFNDEKFEMKEFSSSIEEAEHRIIPDANWEIEHVNHYMDAKPGFHEGSGAGREGQLRSRRGHLQNMRGHLGHLGSLSLWTYVLPLLENYMDNSVAAVERSSARAAVIGDMREPAGRRAMKDYDIGTISSHTFNQRASFDIGVKKAECVKKARSFTAMSEMEKAGDTENIDYMNTEVPNKLNRLRHLIALQKMEISHRLTRQVRWISDSETEEQDWCGLMTLDIRQLWKRRCIK